jgi:hypothetical protein
MVTLLALLVGAGGVLTVLCLRVISLAVLGGSE